MKGRKPNSEQVVPFTGGKDAGRFDAQATQRARELRPDELPFEIRNIWDRLAPPLCHPQRKRLHEGNVYMFETLCWTIARYERLRLDVWENGESYTSETRNGDQQKSRPEVGQLNETWRQVRGLASDFGMTPASERAVQASGQMGFSFNDDDDGADDFD
jgi:P27 family predicted phage terminase small subunit